jgi:hypothetical protein
MKPPFEPFPPEHLDTVCEEKVERTLKTSQASVIRDTSFND